jgi:hypothetical protein
MPMKWSSVRRIKSIAGRGLFKPNYLQAGEIGDQIVNTLEQAAMRAQLQELGDAEPDIDVLAQPALGDRALRDCEKAGGAVNCASWRLRAINEAGDVVWLSGLVGFASGGASPTFGFFAVAFVALVAALIVL